MIYEILANAYKENLESEQYPYDDGKSTDLRIAKQFAWIHKQALKENRNLDEQEFPEA